MLLFHNQPSALAWLLDPADGSFIYVAVSDIIPGINANRHNGPRKVRILGLEPGLLIPGAVVIGVAVTIAQHFGG